MAGNPSFTVMPELDACNCAVPDWLAEVFAGRRELHDWIKRLQTLRQELTFMAAQKYGTDIEIGPIWNQLDAAIANVRLGMPYQECVCDADTYNCPMCDGKRWISVGRVLKVFPQAPRPRSLASLQDSVP
jgi:hypothetical protein